MPFNKLYQKPETSEYSPTWFHECFVDALFQRHARETWVMDLPKCAGISMQKFTILQTPYPEEFPSQSDIYIQCNSATESERHLGKKSWKSDEAVRSEKRLFIGNAISRIFDGNRSFSGDDDLLHAEDRPKKRRWGAAGSIRLAPANQESIVSLKIYLVIQAAWTKVLRDLPVKPSRLVGKAGYRRNNKYAARSWILSYGPGKWNSLLRNGQARK